jgi:hypothetical protein
MLDGFANTRVRFSAGLDSRVLSVDDPRVSRSDRTRRVGYDMFTSTLASSTASGSVLILGDGLYPLDVVSVHVADVRR